MDSASKRLLLGGLPPGHEPGGQLTLTCSAGTHSHFSPGTYFYRQGLPCPFHVCFTCPVLKSTSEEESQMAGVYHSVAKGGRVNGSQSLCWLVFQAHGRHAVKWDLVH